MADPTLSFLTVLAVLLLAGIFTTLISRYLKIPNILLLILIGMVMGFFPYFDFPPLFLTATSILALVMIVFDSSSRFKFREFNLFSFSVLKLTVIFLLFNLTLLTLATLIVDPDIINIWFALIFSSLMSGTDPATIMTIFKDTKSKVAQFLEVESLVNTPVVVLIPFIILDLMNNLQGANVTVVSSFVDQIIPFLQQIISGLGAGIFVGIIVFRIMRRQYSETLSPIAIITSALLSYIIAENLGGNGVLAVTIMGLFFGTVYVKEKSHLSEFSSMFANSLEILLFILIGLIISVPFTFNFFFKSILLFVIYIFIRGLAIFLSLKSEHFNVKDKIFMSLSVQKGIAVAVVAFTLSTLNIPGIQPVLNLSLAFLIYSIILSTLLAKFSHLIFGKNFIPTQSDTVSSQKKKKN
ncbi:MAG: cation:proton antiporter [Candidatus Woesearchaeota archaeon]